MIPIPAPRSRPRERPTVQGRIGAGRSDQAVAHVFPAGGYPQTGCGRVDG